MMDNNAMMIDGARRRKRDVLAETGHMLLEKLRTLSIPLSSEGSSGTSHDSTGAASRPTNYPATTTTTTMTTSNRNTTGGTQLQQQQHSPQQTQQKGKPPGRRVLGREFLPETEVTVEAYARKPGVVPKMWDAAEDEMLRAAVERYGEEDWKRVAEALPNRTHLQCLQRWKKALKPGLVKGHWTAEEDARLLELLKVTQDWQAISNEIPGRNPKQCRERWFLNLDPSINHGPWSEEEDELLLKLQAEYGGRWAQIAKLIPGRTENAVKTRHHTLQRKEVKERGWLRWEDRLVVEFCLESGRQWSVLVKKLVGRSKGQVKKRYLTLMQQLPDLCSLVEAAEMNITNNIPNSKAASTALRLISLGPPEQEKPPASEKPAQNDPKLKTQSFRVPPKHQGGGGANTTTTSSSSSSAAAGTGAAKKNGLKGTGYSSSSIQKALANSRKRDSQNKMQRAPSSSTQALFPFAVSNGGVASAHQGGAGTTMMEVDDYQSRPGATTASGYQYNAMTISPSEQPRKKLVHQKGSSWLDDVDAISEELQQHPTKLIRTRSMEMLDNLFHDSDDNMIGAGTVSVIPSPTNGSNPPPFYMAQQQQQQQQLPYSQMPYPAGFDGNVGASSSSSSVSYSNYAFGNGLKAPGYTNGNVKSQAYDNAAQKVLAMKASSTFGLEQMNISGHIDTTIGMLQQRASSNAGHQQQQHLAPRMESYNGALLDQSQGSSGNWLPLLSKKTSSDSNQSGHLNFEDPDFFTI